jgi:hypothetical protein
MEWSIWVAMMTGLRREMDHLQRPFDILMGGVDSYHIHPGVVERREERHVAPPV